VGLRQLAHSNLKRKDDYYPPYKGFVRENMVLSKTRQLCQREHGFVKDGQLCQRGHGFVKDEAALSERTRFCQRRGSSDGEKTALSERMCLHVTGWRLLCRRGHHFVKEHAALLLLERMLFGGRG
jgi:hypothetical protein